MIFFYDTYGNFINYEKFKSLEINKIFSWNHNNYSIININKKMNRISDFKLLTNKELPKNNASYFKNQNILSMFLFCEEYSESINNMKTILIFPSLNLYTIVYRNDNYNFIVKQINSNYFSSNEKINEKDFDGNLYIVTHN